MPDFSSVTVREQLSAAMRKKPVTWDQVRAKLAEVGQSMQEWAGLPMPAKGMRMVIHPSYPFAKKLGETFMPEPVSGVRYCRNEDISEDVELRNEWSSYRDGKTVRIWRDGKKYFHAWGPRVHTGTMLIDSMQAARSWDIQSELRAMETLRRHVTQWAFECYQLTGSFLETSKRSGIHYMFRRLRPTVAMSSQPDYRKGRDVGVRILCTLCAHPVGFYSGTWCGALVPTDDVLAHLLLARADEHLLWKMSEQHHPLAPESGL